MAWNGKFFNGVWSMGFDMDPAAAEIFDIGAAGAGSNSVTPFGSGWSWQSSGAPGVTLGVNLTTMFIGCRFYWAALPGTSGIVLNFYDVTAAAAQVTLRIFSDGSLRFYLGAGTGTPIGSASVTGLVSATTWVYLEAKVVINGAGAGSVELRVNGNATPVITQGSVTTQSTANTWVSGLILTSPNGNTVTYDDWYMLDSTGTAPLNTYLGNIRIVSDAPNAAGSHTQWTPTNPTNVNWSNTANIPANTAQYNSDGTVADIDSYAFPAIGGSPVSVLFLNHWYKTELDTAGARTVVPGCRSGATDFFDTTAQTPPNGTYKYFNKPWTVDPNTSAAWTIANAQSAELAVKINT